MLTTPRRLFLSTSTTLGAGLLLAGCSSARNPQSEPTEKESEQKSEIEVTATEDLMREHGVLRRALLVYSSAALRLRKNDGSVPPDTLQKPAKLFRTFGEDYHEKSLEESFIFPAVKKAGGTAAPIADVLMAQHQRGREITDYILSVAANQRLKAATGMGLAQTLESFVLMYRHHAAREDTTIFPAWKKTLTPAEFADLNEKFEDIEHQQFGKDGFEDAVTQIAAIEESLGLSDIAQFTAPAPPPK